MSRNLSDRVEAIVPISDPRIKEQLDVILAASLNDRRLAWEMLPDGRYRQRIPDTDKGMNAAGTDTAEATMGTHKILMRHARASASQFLG